MGNKNNFGKWRMQSSIASLAWEDLRIEINPQRPAVGATLKVAQSDLIGQLFSISGLSVSSAETLDPFARGRDLIVSYPVAKNRPIGTEIYWRWTELEESENPIGQLELIYSLETHLLDTAPNPSVSSRVFGQTLRLYGLASDQTLCPLSADSNETSIATLLQSASLKILLAVIPSDLKQLKITPDSSSMQINAELNAEFLEKGVIRRLRLFAALGNGDCETDLQNAANQFLVSEVPLTA